MMTATILRPMLVGLNLLRASSYSLSHQKIGGWITSPRIARGGMRYMTANSERTSVSGTIYLANEDAPMVTLFTKEGCTLCDKVKDVLVAIKSELPHSLEAVDITDEENERWFSKYKYDIPVLHIGGQYWIKHRLEENEAREGLLQAIEGNFQARRGEPDAGEMERRQAKRYK